jgi:TrmH RNA methyltransferase
MSNPRFSELKIHGLAAVQAFFAKNPDAIKRLYFDLATGRKVAKISSHLARQKRIYRVVPPDELEKIADTVHHGGIVAVVEERALATPALDHPQEWARRRLPILLLDRVGNAHNLGAIARTAAFFGVEHLVVPTDPRQAGHSGAAHRVAEGGMAHVQIHQVPDLAGFCRELAADYDVLGAAAGGRAVSVREWRKTRGVERRTPGRPIALVLGNEEHGLSREVAGACTALVTIPGSGRVESLNVSAAAAILMWEFWVDRPEARR